MDSDASIQSLQAHIRSLQDRLEVIEKKLINSLRNENEFQDRFNAYKALCENLEVHQEAVKRIEDEIRPFQQKRHRSYKQEEKRQEIIQESSTRSEPVPQGVGIEISRTVPSEQIPEDLIAAATDIKSAPEIEDSHLQATPDVLPELPFETAAEERQDKLSLLEIKDQQQPRRQSKTESIMSEPLPSGQPFGRETTPPSAAHDVPDPPYRSPLVQRYPIVVQLPHDLDPGHWYTISCGSCGVNSHGPNMYFDGFRELADHVRVCNPGGYTGDLGDKWYASKYLDDWDKKKILNGYLPEIMPIDHVWMDSQGKVQRRGEASNSTSGGGASRRLYAAPTRTSKTRSTRESPKASISPSPKLASKIPSGIAASPPSANIQRRLSSSPPEGQLARPTSRTKRTVSNIARTGPSVMTRSTRQTSRELPTPAAPAIAGTRRTSTTQLKAKSSNKLEDVDEESQ